MLELVEREEQLASLSMLELVEVRGGWQGTMWGRKRWPARE
jgi:hypothetical protein